MLPAALPPDKARSRVAAMALGPLTSRSAAGPAAVLAELEACRDRGYAVRDGEPELALRSMAVPVIDRGGHTVAALSIAVRADRWSLADLVAVFCRRCGGRNIVDAAAA